MSKKFYQPASRSPGLSQVQSQVFVPNGRKIIKSKSYLAKLQEKKDLLARESMINSREHVGNSREANIISQSTRGEELTEKPSIFSERSVCKSEVSFEQRGIILNHEDEELLNNIRLQKPKAELRASPGRCPSPSNNYIISERCEEAERDLKGQRAKYRRLEAQYNDLLTKNSHIEHFYTDIISNLKSELEKCDTPKSSDPGLHLLLAEITEIKSKFGGFEAKFNYLEEKLKNKNK